MSKNIPGSSRTRLTAIVRRVPKAIAAAVNTLLATLTRPDDPPVGSVEFLAQFGVWQDDLQVVLQMFLDDRAVRPRKLYKRFGNAGGTNLLSVCEIMQFIAKPEGGSWRVDLARIDRFLGRVRR